MKPAPFELLTPRTLPDAIALFAADDEAIAIAGGQSLIPMMNFRISQPRKLVDLGRIPELSGITEQNDKIVIGATTTHNTVLQSPVIKRNCPLVATAYAYVAHHTIRNRGTLGGNICHADPASEMPAVLQALDAEFQIAGSAGSRTILATEFFKGPYETALGDGEILIAIAIGKQSEAEGHAFREMSVRKGDFAIAGVASRGTATGSKINMVRLAVCGVGGAAHRLGQVEEYLDGKTVTADAISEAARLAAETVTPQSDLAGSENYRKALVESLTREALQETFAAS